MHKISTGPNGGRSDMAIPRASMAMPAATADEVTV